MIDWHLSNITWLLEQQNDYLRQILETLQAPLDTMAKELRRRAEQAFKNGWYEDALRDFLESEKLNPYDFAVHHSLGLIYLQMEQQEDALSYFQKAVKYAEPKSKLHTSYSQLFIARIHRLQGNLNSATEVTNLAVTIAPNFPEAHYQHAVSLALVDNIDQALKSLKNAIELDPYYALKPRADDEIAKIYPALSKLEEDIYDEAKQRATVLLDKAKQAISLTENDKEARGFFGETENLYRRDSFLDYLEASTLAQKTIRAALNAIEAKIKAQSSVAFSWGGVLAPFGLGFILFVLSFLCVGFAGFDPNSSVASFGTIGMLLAILIAVGLPVLFVLWYVFSKSRYFVTKTALISSKNTIDKLLE